MSMFNTESVGSKTVNYAGGEAYKTNPKFEFVSILLTSFLQNQFYRSGSDTLKKLTDLIPQVGYKFAAQAALYARREFGMRSVSHVVGGEVAKHVKDETWTKTFLTQLFKRPDDMLEVVSYYVGKYGKRPIPNTLKKAVAKRLSSLDEYGLAKYRGEGKAFKMVDLVNLTHPKGTPAIEKLVKGTLKSVDTWETKLTQAGQKAETEEEKGELKNAAWRELLSEKKLGYLALLRNARNIIQQAPDCINMLQEQLVDDVAIRKSLVFPFQILRATKEIQAATGATRGVVNALVAALEKSLANVPRFSGKTLIVVDNSASMQGCMSEKGKTTVAEIAGVFAACLYKVNEADMMAFSNEAHYISPVSTDSIISIAKEIFSACVPSGTDFKSIFRRIKGRYNRIIILSDMQGWVDYYAPTQAFNRYCAAEGCRPYVYSFDLQGLGTTQFPDSMTFCLSGLSDKIFDIMGKLEEDKGALIKRIESEQFLVQ